ncbi:uncharacterized protein LOC124285977 isoform X2 [Haliotis rubra]|uniref:uncharacterized protein LOC124285977 isoform X2 n=1 Tax=Haliotis rubra TaxID=36100 RepID=UPI001EE636C6|nr:uncharacterized protein LOC124285977 isoform X2 [Haliotis rubra]
MVQIETSGNTEYLLFTVMYIQRYQNICMFTRKPLLAIICHIRRSRILNVNSKFYNNIYFGFYGNRLSQKYCFSFPMAMSKRKLQPERYNIEKKRVLETVTVGRSTITGEGIDLLGRCISSRTESVQHNCGCLEQAPLKPAEDRLKFSQPDLVYPKPVITRGVSLMSQNNMNKEEVDIETEGNRITCVQEDTLNHRESCDDGGISGSAQDVDVNIESNENHMHATQLEQCVKNVEVLYCQPSEVALFDRSDPQSQQPDRSDTTLSDPKSQQPDRSDTTLSDPQSQQPDRSDTTLSDPQSQQPDRSDTTLSDPQSQQPDRSDTTLSDPQSQQPDRSDTTLSDPQSQQPDQSDTTLSDPQSQQPDQSDTTLSDPQCRQFAQSDTTQLHFQSQQSVRSDTTVPPTKADMGTSRKTKPTVLPKHVLERVEQFVSKKCDSDISWIHHVVMLPSDTSRLDSEAEDACLFGNLFSEQEDVKTRDQAMHEKKSSVVGSHEESGEVAKGKGDRQIPRKPSPNYFVAVQITNPQIHSGLSHVQQEVMSVNHKMKEVMIKLPTLHITLMVMSLQTEEDIARARAALTESGCELRERFKTLPVLEVAGLGTFRNQVVFATVSPGDALDDLTHIHQCVIDKMADHEVVSTETKGLTPHITIMKMSKVKAAFRRSVGLY